MVLEIRDWVPADELLGRRAGDSRREACARVKRVDKRSRLQGFAMSMLDPSKVFCV